MKLYERSIYASDFTSLTYTGVTDAAAAIDNDRDTIVRSLTADPDLTLTAPEMRTADSVWIKTTGYTNVEIIADGVSLGSQSIPTTGNYAGYVYREFTETTALVWTLRFTGTGGVWEAYLQKKILDFDTDDKRPLKIRVSVFSGLYERTASGDIAAFRAFGFGGGDATITLEWELLDNASTAELFEAWKSSTPRNREMAVFPRPTLEPDGFYQVQWISDFAFKYTGLNASQGQSGSALFQELDTQA